MCKQNPDITGVTGVPFAPALAIDPFFLVDTMAEAVGTLLCRGPSSHQGARTLLFVVYFGCLCLFLRDSTVGRALHAMALADSFSFSLFGSPECAAVHLANHHTVRNHFHVC